MRAWLGLALGSLAGGFARYGLAGAIQARLGPAFPYGTLVVNLSGCLLIGFLDSLAVRRLALGPEARLLLMGGFCGAFTTFSGLVLDTANMLRAGEAGRALLNVAASLLAGFLLFLVGLRLGERL